MVHRYKDEKSSMPPHSDNVAVIDTDSSIFTLSLGQPRDMMFHEIIQPNTVNVPLKHGDILVMSSESQKNYKHSIPMSEMAMTCRLSVTFRCIKPPQPEHQLISATTTRIQDDSSNIHSYTETPTVQNIRNRRGPGVRVTNQQHNLRNNLNETVGTPARRNRKCLIIHDSLLDLYDNERFYPKADKVLLRAKTLKNLNDAKNRRKIRSYEGSLLHLLQTTAAKIIFSLVLPTGRDNRLNDRVTQFNGLAVELGVLHETYS